MDNKNNQTLPVSTYEEGGHMQGNNENITGIIYKSRNIYEKYNFLSNIKKYEKYYTRLYS